MNVVLLTIAPIAFIIIYIYVKDKYEKEPKKLLVKTFLGGAIISVIATILISTIANKIFPVSDSYNLFQQFIKAFIVVALVEEFSKYIVVRFYAQKKTAFNEPFDGIVYAVMVSMGFAFTENILYVMDGGFYTALARAFTAVPAHATFGIIMGYYMGIAKFSRHRIKYNLLGLLYASLFHGAYDFFLFINFIPGIWIGAVLSLIIGIVLSKKAIKKHQSHSQFKY
ncbi:MAG: protease PrsW [Bacteroidetes bacterium MedPE-SWsnd-G1]|nr:MAG: protease PrsW [Bacteroidetes bacterium MedPE-SWsnd-G1]